MKKFNLYAALLILTSFDFSASNAQSLSNREKSALNEYWAKDPAFGAYSSRIKDAVLNNPQNAGNLKACAKVAFRYKILNQISELEDVSKMHDIVESNLEKEDVNRLFPGFNANDYYNARFLALRARRERSIKGIKDVIHEIKGGQIFQEAYFKLRKQNYSPINALSSAYNSVPGIISEFINKLDTEEKLKKSTGMTAAELALLFLENDYLDVYRDATVNRIKEEMTSTENAGMVCNKIALNLFKDMPADNPQKETKGNVTWDGVFKSASGSTITIKGMEGKYVWDASFMVGEAKLIIVEKNDTDAKGTWRDIAGYALREGTFEAELAGAELIVDFKETKPSEGVSSRFRGIKQ